MQRSFQILHHEKNVMMMSDGMMMIYLFIFAAIIMLNKISMFSVLQEVGITIDLSETENKTC